MNDISLLIAIPVSLLLIFGSLIAFIGTLGLLRLPTFYQRIHGPAITITFGCGSILLASMLYFTATQERLIIHELLITAFTFLSAPVVAMMIMRAAVYRDLRKVQSKTPNIEAKVESLDTTCPTLETKAETKTAE